jgi:hypothetical protein
MPLQAIDLKIDPDVQDTTECEQELIAAADARKRSFLRRRPDITTLLNSDPDAFCHGVRELLHRGILGGLSFCEWGSGIGMISALAAQNGLEAYGVEMEADFVAEARALCCDFALATTLACGSFVPAETANDFHVVGTYGATDWRITTDLDVYGLLGRRCSEMDLIYAYPWPREVALYEQLFDLTAHKDAILWLYRQGDTARLLVKT